MHCYRNTLWPVSHVYIEPLTAHDVTDVTSPIGKIHFRMARPVGPYKCIVQNVDAHIYIYTSQFIIVCGQ